MAEIKINPNRSTLYLEWGGDLIVSQTGGVVLAYGWDQVKQRIMRRLLTNPKFKLHDGEKVPPEYIFDVEYGLGFRRRLGEPNGNDQGYLDELRALCYNAVIVDEGVDTTRAPKILLSESNHRVYVDITVYLSTRETGKLYFAFSS